jgi:predicted dehydrogenase
MSHSSLETERRGFLKSAGVGLLILKSETVFGSQANSAIELGVIGCGGRGSWIGGLFKEHVGARVVALADPFPDRMDDMRKQLNIPDTRTYARLDGYKELLASHVDAVAIESPPYYHPEQAAAAVAAGKHVYMAKPVAVDVPGCASVGATAQAARDRVSFLVDFQTRAQPVFQDCVERIHRGDIGKPVLGHVYYQTGRIAYKETAGMNPARARLRNWLFDKTLSGDIIVEQNIHVLDAACWYLQSHPLKAMGTGGRKVRVELGDCWDHFVVTYWFPGEVLVDFSSTQCIAGYDDLCIRVYGSEGTADTHYSGAVRITGKHPWTGTEKDRTGSEGPVVNIKRFVDSVRTGKYLNNAADSVQSNLTSILGRMAAYRGGTVTWDQMLHANERLDAHLDTL